MDHSPLNSITATQWNECLDISTLFPCFFGLRKHLNENTNEWNDLMCSSKPLEVLDKMNSK